MVATKGGAREQYPAHLSDSGKEDHREYPTRSAVQPVDRLVGSATTGVNGA